ncbi:MAG: glycoside hydrolase family 30 beta sandwich domain-containing protein [Rikenellaceae bacterium]
MKRNLLLIALMMTLSAANIYAQKAKLIYTTESDRWVEAKKSVKINKEAQEADITIYTDQPLQVVDGVGGSFNELGWDAIQTLPSAKAQEVIDALFSAQGCNFSMCRLPIGASDYALSWYSSNESHQDFVMRDFNIDRDRYILMKYIKAALAVRPDLQLWASPWCSPSWMKINEHYSTRGGDWGNRTNGNRMAEGADVFNHATAFNMQERYLKAYALYFSKFVQAYAAEGVELFAIMPQNEIAYAPNWPSCTWRAEDFSYFIGKFLGPQFEADGIETDIWLGTINWSNPNYCETILDNDDASKYIKGVGFQWGGERALPSISKNYPHLKFMQTENRCGENENDWTSLVSSWNSMVHYFQNNSNAYLYWNMVLDKEGMSAWGWPQNSMISIDRETGDVIYNDEFYLFKHLSHFVQPGTQVLSASEGKNHLAFRLNDGSTMLLVYNPDEEAKSVTVQAGDVNITTQLQAKSINSLVIE